MNPILVPNLDDLEEFEKTKGKMYDLLDERLKAVEKHDIPPKVDASKLSLITDLVLPTKFKMPRFMNYDGTKCPMLIS